MYKRLEKLRWVIFGCLLSATLVPADARVDSPVGPEGAQLETRCGWFENPTPANMSFYDKDGEWIIGVQGGYQVPGDWEAPNFKPRQWVRTNTPDYGYGCACFRLHVDRKTQKVLEIKRARALPLTSCRKDQGLKRWRHMFR